jgi:hypothetical protein
MSGWLLDTNVVSELVKGEKGDRGVREWVEKVDERDLHLSVITLGEIAKGIDRAQSAGRAMVMQRHFLEHALPERFGERILPFGAAAAVTWGHILQGLRGDDERRLAIVAQIAATAKVADLQVCTRNVRDFQRLGSGPVVNPFSS